MKVLYSRPLTAPKIQLPQNFHQVEDESDLSWRLAQRFPWTGRYSEHLARVHLALTLFGLRRGCDVVVTGRYGEWFALLQSFVPFGKRPHLLLDVEWYESHSSPWRQKFNRWLHRRIIQGATRVQVFCQVEAHNYAAYFGVQESKFVWIPYCTDANLAAAASSENAGYIFTSGVHQRDYKTLLTAVAGLPVELRIAAPRAEFQFLEVPENVTLLGELPAAEYWQTLMSANFLVLSLRPETLRRPGVITYAGAMRMGKCVVVNDPLGAASYIRDGETGFLVPPAEPQTLRDKICFLLDHPETVNTVWRNAEEAARKSFSVAHYITAVESAIAALVTTPYTSFFQ
jgi:glycosyltransferase involved in cell wall biosynthesis